MLYQFVGPTLYTNSGVGVKSAIVDSFVCQTCWYNKLVQHVIQTCCTNICCLTFIVNLHRRSKFCNSRFVRLTNMLVRLVVLTCCTKGANSLRNSLWNVRPTCWYNKLDKHVIPTCWNVGRTCYTNLLECEHSRTPTPKLV